MERKSYVVSLPIFKQGDDLYRARQQSNSDAEGFRLYAEQLKYSAEIIEKLAMFAADDQLSLECADTHMIYVKTTDEVANLLKDDIVKDEFDEDFFEEE